MGEVWRADVLWTACSGEAAAIGVLGASGCSDGGAAAGAADGATTGVSAPEDVICASWSNSDRVFGSPVQEGMPSITLYSNFLLIPHAESCWLLH